MKKVLDSKGFWKMMRPCLSDKNIIFLQISSQKNNRIISYPFDLPEEFSTFLENAVRSLIVKPDEFYLSDAKKLSDPVEIAIKRFEKHPSV